MAASEYIWIARLTSRFLCWSASFYPQPILNWRRRSTVGLAVDYPTINVLGFMCYTMSTAAFLYSPIVREQYAARNPLSPVPTVRFNDLAFASHAVVLSAIAYSQFWCWGFKRDRAQRLSKPIAGIISGCILGLMVVTYIITTSDAGDGGRQDPFGWAWIDLVYAISYVKLVVTIVKYIPQVLVNYERKSTVGWSIEQIMLDLAGGVLSIAQLVLDSGLQGDWSGITGNPVKLGLGNFSIAFDLIFLVQHYFLYADVREPASDSLASSFSSIDGPLRRPLLSHPSTPPPHPPPPAPARTFTGDIERDGRRLD